MKKVEAIIKPFKLDEVKTEDVILIRTDGVWSIVTDGTKPVALEEYNADSLLLIVDQDLPGQSEAAGPPVIIYGDSLGDLVITADDLFGRTPIYFAEAPGADTTDITLDLLI